MPTKVMKPGEKQMQKIEDNYQPMKSKCMIAVGAVFSRLDAEAARCGAGLVFTGSSQLKRVAAAAVHA